MLNILPAILFQLGSLYLSYEDIKNRSITLWIFLSTLIVGVINALPITLTMDLLIPNILFFAIVLIVAFIKKVKVIAWADIFYFFIIIILIQDLWWLYFICIGLLSFIFHYANYRQKDQPFIAILYGAFIVMQVYIFFTINQLP